MIKKIVLTILLLLSTSTLAAPMLVLDMRNAPTLPKNFRSSSGHLPGNINTQGLANLHIAGGGEFSKESLKTMLNFLHTKNVMIIDLRQEPHGLLNSNAISWYAPENAANAGKKSAQIEQEQAALLTALGEQKTAIVNNILKKSPEGKIEKVKTIEYLVHQANSEQELVNQMNLKYKRIYVQDHHIPSEKEVDRFLEIARNLPENRWIYFHCRAGEARTSTFMIMYDIYRNAKQVSLSDIFVRQTLLGGKNFSQLPEQDSPKFKLAVERLQFIKRFYEYAHNNTDNYATSWSDWVKLHSVQTALL